MGNIFRITLGSSIGSATFDYPYNKFSLNNSFDFNTGSELLGDFIKNQWGCGSCGILDVNNNGIMLGIRRVESENKTKFDLIEIKKIGNKIERNRVSPSKNYPNFHYQDLAPIEVKVEWVEDGNVTIIGSKKIS